MDKQDILEEIEYYLAKIKILLTKYKEEPALPVTKVITYEDSTCTSCEG